MNNKKVSDKNFKVVCSVTELCRDLRLSRAQFYNLQNMGIFPKGLKDERTNRPYFDTELQIRCHQIRNTGMGHNGQPYLFYSPRTHPGKPRGKRDKSVNNKYKDYASTLEQMGLSVSVEQITKALAELYPESVGGIDEGIIIRELFRKLKGQ